MAIQTNGHMSNGASLQSPSTNAPQKTELVAPTINIAPFLEDPRSAASEKIVQSVRDACERTGFFQLVGHGISREFQQDAFNAAKNFFDLPFEEKKKLDAKTTVGHRGYDVLASQSYLDGVMPDLKEGFYVGENLPFADTRVKAKRFFLGQNVWPPQSCLAPNKFAEPAEGYFKAVYDLSLVVLDLIARSLPYGDDIFDTFKAQNPATPLRFLHYPPARDTEIPQFGASEHTDFGAITLLLQDHNPGLQIQDNVTKEWVPVPPNPDAYVVNVGDMLSMWTANQYKSSVHRVLNQNVTDRYSIVFFFDGNLDCPLAPLDGSKVEGHIPTVEEHMLKRMAASYGGGKGSKS